MSDYWETLQQRYAESNKRLAALPHNSFTYEGGGSFYARKTALYAFNNKKAADPNEISDFDLMVMYDGNPCFGGSVVRHPASKDYPCGSATITVYTD